jgi:hypothetical protein
LDWNRITKEASVNSTIIYLLRRRMMQVSPFGVQPVTPVELMNNRQKSGNNNNKQKKETNKENNFKKELDKATKR